MATVFISYAHVTPDQELASELSAALEAHGFSVFVDSKIRLGQNWVEQIDRQLRASKFFVPLLSPVSVESDMVRREIALAYKLRKANKLTILPVRLGLEGELPYDIGAYLDSIQYTSWRTGQLFEPVCRAVVEALTGSTVIISERPGAATRTPPPPITHSHTTENPERFSSLELEHLREALATYVGPMARMIVERATRKAATWEQLYEILAADLPAGEDRKKFLMSRRR